MSMKEAMESGKFELQHLTESINEMKTPQLRLAQLGYFKEDGITTTHADIEYQNGSLIIVSDKERGEAGDQLDDLERKGYTFKAVHLPVSGSILADKLQNVRAFGEAYGNGTGGEQFDKVIGDYSKRSKMSIELTIEMLRFGAMKGKVVGKSGKVIADLFKIFEIEPTAAVDEIDYSDAKGVRNQHAAALRNSKKHQNGALATKYRALSSASYIDALLLDPGFAKAYERYQDGKAFREDVRGGIEWDGIIWEEHTGIYPDGSLMVEEGTALLIPEDNDGLFITLYAPANYNETVNTYGLPLYSKAEAMKFDKGMELESQSNPINVCTNPLAVRTLRMVAPPTRAATKKAA